MHLLPVAFAWSFSGGVVTRTFGFVDDVMFSYNTPFGAAA